MSKRIIAVLMISGMMLSMAACNGASFLPVKETSSATTTTIALPSTSETTEDTTAEETTTEETTTEETTSEETTTEETTTEETTTTSETTKAATPTPKPIGKTTVSNAYSRTFKDKVQGKFTTKYPKVTIKGVSTAAVNKEIANKFNKIAKDNEYYISYSYYIGKKYVSILITVHPDLSTDGEEYYVYNISRVTGKKLTKAEMLNLLNIKSGTFNTKVKKAVKKWWSDILKDDKTSKTKKMYNNSIASKSINSAVPYVNSKGKTCFLLRQVKAPTQFVYNDICGKI